MPITEVTNINADTTVYGKWVYSETYNINEIYFYYKKMPDVQYVSYTIEYRDMFSDYELISHDTKIALDGDRVTEYYKTIYGFTPLENSLTQEVHEGTVFVFLYYEEYDPINP